MFFPGTRLWSEYHRGEIFDLPPLDIVEQSFRVEVRHVLVNSQPMDYTYEVISGFANNGMM